MPQPSLAGWLTLRRKAIVLLALTVVAYLSALNRDQSLPWAIGALLGATLLTGFLWPRWLVRRLSVTRRGPSRAEEGETIRFRVEVSNPGWLPRFMVELVDRLPFVGLADPEQGGGEKVLGVLAYLPGRRTSAFDVPVLCEKRGHYRLGPVSLASCFPLGLAEARLRRNDGVQALTIYPDVFSILGLPLRGAPSQIHRGGYLLPEGAGAAEFSGLREYRRGDNPRHIHWPTTARLNELMVREYEPLASACLSIVLDQAAESNVGLGKESTFEYAVRIAASIARYGCTQSIRTRLAGAGGQTWLQGQPGTGDAHYQGILDQLAVVDCDGVTPYARLLDQVAQTTIRGETVVIFLAEQTARTRETLHALTLLRAKQANLFAVIFDRDSFTAAGPAGDNAQLTAALIELGACYVPVRRGDDLVQLFNR
ncbi:DUF58 domain-containing protein [Dechloromonas denitrificans]|uniref:DUF58 domain-containing protein n=1 Tax=Dechloromonas denitrificans TaxID=281362 RepID=UPI001CFB9D7A|nr:DUF58 domain-containing protein [Dechloromonas denitrificans]UCV08597.1 DUF58 domain-containing protein [Dechloromonas denitrificans]